MDEILRLSVLPMLIVLIIFAAVCVGQPQNGTPPPTTALQPTQTITPVPTDTPVPTPVPTGTSATTVPTVPVTTVTTALPSPAQIMIISPQSGQTLAAGDVVIITSVNDFTVVDRQGQANVAGEGHVHFYMDVDPVPEDPGTPAIPANATTVWAHVSGTAYTFTNVPPGEHTFTVQLVNNDHTPVIPLATDSITVTFTGTIPAPTPTTPGGGGGY